MPTMKNRSDRIGAISMPAMSRGRMRYCSGDTAIDSSASICSVMRMVPSSVAMPAPARPDSISADSTGASSTARARPVVPPANDSSWNCRNA